MNKLRLQQLAVAGLLLLFMGPGFTPVRGLIQP